MSRGIEGFTRVVFMCHVGLRVLHVVFMCHVGLSLGLTHRDLFYHIELHLGCM